MTDADVGKLWEDVYLRRDCPQVEALILKLVEERATVYDNGDMSNDGWHKMCVERALDAFGIPFAEYETAIRQANDPKV